MCILHTHTGGMVDAVEMNTRESLSRGAAAMGIIATGAFLRLYELGTRSLWLDEAWLANGIIRFRLATILTHPHPAKPPPLFVASVRCLVVAFGNSEFVLRLVPSLFGIGVLVLLYYACKKAFNPDLALYATALASFSPPLIFYSREFKQYSCEAFFTLALFLPAWHYSGTGSAAGRFLSIPSSAFSRPVSRTAHYSSSSQ